MRFLAHVLFALAPVAVSAAPAAQDFRFELGQHLRAFEIAFEERADPAIRARALPHLKEAVARFFALQPGEAARSIDRARFALLSEDPPPAAAVWASALSVRPACRFLDAGAAALEATLAALYEIDGTVPDGAVLALTLDDAAGKRLASSRATIPEIPWRGSLPLASAPEGDARLCAEIEVAGIRVALGAQTISFAARILERLGSIEEMLAKTEGKPDDTQRATIASHLAILSALARGETLETNYPAAGLLAEAEKALEAGAAGESFFARRPGEYWLALADDAGRMPSRLMAPDAAAKGEPLPLVIALHGAGGSENLFFDGYGAGKIVGLCRGRGWLLVAPRSGFFGLGATADRIVAAVDRIHPVDRARIAVVGHSMGAMQGVTWAQQASDPIAAVAALGGGGRVFRPDRLKRTAFFVGVGSDDFALGGARRLHRDLQAADVRTVRFQEYTGVEHLAVVQVALDEVIAWIERAFAAPPAPSR